jgi:1-acyl-sn-glycerol-3-phosphate acyltransferase
VGLHLCWGAATVAVAYPWIEPRLRRALKQRWSRQLLEILGIKLCVRGTAVVPAGLLVANHVSWLDIFVINALTPAAFVSKDDVRHWPLIGWLCTHTETIFLERGSRTAAQRTLTTMVDRLHAG